MNSKQNESPAIVPISSLAYMMVIASMFCAVSGFLMGMVLIVRAASGSLYLTAFTRNFVFISSGIYSAIAAILIPVYIYRLYGGYQNYRIYNGWDIDALKNTQKALLVLGLSGHMIYRLTQCLYDAGLLALALAVLSVVMVIAALFGDYRF